MYVVIGEGGAGRVALIVEASEPRRAVAVARREDWHRSDSYQVVAGYCAPRGARERVIATTSGGGEATAADIALAAAIVGDPGRFRAEAERKGYFGPDGQLTRVGRAAARLTYGLDL